MDQGRPLEASRDQQAPHHFLPNWLWLTPLSVQFVCCAPSIQHKAAMSRFAQLRETRSRARRPCVSYPPHRRLPVPVCKRCPSSACQHSALPTHPTCHRLLLAQEALPTALGSNCTRHPQTEPSAPGTLACCSDLRWMSFLGACPQCYRPGFCSGPKINLS